MINTICRFLAIPSTVFYFQCDPPDTKEPSCTNVRRFAIMRLAQCIQINQDKQKSQIAVSTLYSLLNQMTQYDHEEQELLPGSVDVQNAPATNQQLTSEQQEQLCINALSAIIGIAVRLEEDDATLSMLVLRRRVLSKTATLALIRQLVDLALVSPIQVFCDIINVFTIIGREALSHRDGVIESQLDLAQRLKKRPEHYVKFLDHILIFFVDAGMLIQHMEQSQKGGDDQYNICMVRSVYLARMLPIIQALLQHNDFNPQHDATEETVTLFRNMWFHCILFDFVDGDMHDCLLSIAVKTPPLVTKAAADHLESDLEYNSVLVGSGAENSAHAQSLRQRLTTLLGPNCTYSVRNMPFSQIMFTLAVYHLEIMRSFMGDCSFILHYYSKDGIGSDHSYLGQCLQTMVDLCVNTFIKETQKKAANQVLNEQLCTQIQALLPMCCHRLRQVHLLAIKITNRLVNAFPQVFSEKVLITLLLELIQLTWLSCEAWYRDEYTSVYQFTSERAGITLEISDYQAYRQELCSTLYDYGKRWLIISMDMACKEVTGLLQDYLTEYERFSPYMPLDTVHLGRSLALEIGKTAAKNQLYLIHIHVAHYLVPIDFAPNISSVPLDASSDFVHGFTTRIYHTGEINGMNYIAAVDRHQGSFACYDEKSPFGFRVLQGLLDDAKMGRHVQIDRLHGTMLRTAAAIVAQKKVHPDFLAYIVRIPVYIFTAEAMEIGTNVWNWILIECPEVEERLMIEMLGMWQWTQRHRKGLFSPKVNFNDPFEEHMTYKPSDRSDVESVLQQSRSLFIPHLAWIEFIHSRFNATRHMRKNLTSLFIHLLGSTFRNAHLMSTHALSRQPRFHMLWLGLKILETVNMEAFTEHNFRTLVYEAAFNWFCLPPKWHYGPRKSYTLQEYKLMTEFYHALSRDTPRLDQVLTSSQLRLSQSNIASGIYKFVDDKTRDDVLKQHRQKRKLLLLLLENELSRLSVWCNPLNTVGHGHPPCFVGKAEKSITTDDEWKEIVRFAWQMEPRLAVQLGSRFVQPAMFHELHRLIANNSLDVVDCPDALVILLGNGIQPGAKLDLKYLQYWSAVPAVTAANYFLPPFQSHPNILQYAMRVLEYYPVDLVFFYVPQIVQALRYDEYGYVEKYIMEAGQVSQLFAHQIIWNMQANFYIDADKECKKDDPLKPTLERIIKNLVDSFTGEDRSFYERELKFFGEVTAISGYLKEYIKFGQTEKKPLQKQRLDEELAKIKVEKGVYLPSNPDGEVKEIDRTSGKPLQSHAKAPFMATFKIQKEEQIIDLSAIFKVGDDCRQDVLALQLIAVFKNIFTSVGLDLYLYPYRVVATAPGRGVIDVIRNAISRDQLGREKVNNMCDYFIAKYGTPDTPGFQRARTNFVQSLAAYSVLSYLLQFKDRHNGNIMIDSEGHILHIDFGFIFDIAPGGITFESSPFKLTTEMVQVMGGGADEQAFNQFSQLVVKAYLACRPYASQICQLVTLMLESGLPCFKGETIQRMHNRFQLGRSERAAADFIMLRIKDSCENRRTVMYDYFQKLTNGKHAIAIQIHS
ncbi:hypothetical protein K492DRAFT_168123 [Lichtheimia hyalospora FSU 10163]|nr:hypothetical protein K492DRAFT_168123 [Lichtheimia hyalospora FSU 10163]